MPDATSRPTPQVAARGALPATSAPDFGAESVRPVLESLLHLLPTAATLVDAAGNVVLSECASAICQYLSHPPESIGLPHPCRVDVERVAREARDGRCRATGTCTAGIRLAAEPLTAPGGDVGSLGVLVAAVGDHPTGDEHWLEVARAFDRPASKLLEAVHFAPRHGLREWEAVERLEVAASVLTRALTGGARSADSGPRAARAARSAGDPSLVVGALRAAAAATGDDQVLRDAVQRLAAPAALTAAWAVLLREGDVRGPLLVEAPHGLAAARWSDDHPALRGTLARTSAWHEEGIAAWPDAEALARAGIATAVVAPVRVAGNVAALIVLGLRASQASLAAGLIDAANDLALVAGAHLGDARALADERRRNRELRALIDVCARTHASLDVSVVLDAVVDAFIAALGFTRAAVLLHDAATGRVRGVASRGIADQGRIRLVTGPLSAFPAAVEAHRRGQAVHAREGGVPEEYRQIFGVTTYVVVPLAAHGELLGFVGLDRGGAPFEPAFGELELATTLAQPASLALSHARLHAGHLAGALAKGERLAASATLAQAGLPGLAELAAATPPAMTVTRRGGHVQVTVDMPLPPEGSAARAEVEARTPPAADEGTSVLVVDDDDENRVALVALLRSWGVDAVGAANGEAALHALVRRRFDLVLTDLAMPDIDGWAVARRARDLAVPPTVVLLTGYAVDVDAETLAARHVAAVIEKPASPARLREVVRAHERQARA